LHRWGVVGLLQVLVTLEISVVLPKHEESLQTPDH
jgi:hypothetical protein